jgi:histidine triad (HIT) family protein
MNKDNCVFCKIVAKTISSKQLELVHEITEHHTAFHDINPVAPVHVVVIPNDHYISHREHIGTVMEVATYIAQDILGLESYRLVTNYGEDAGQQIEHIHVHILGGHKLGKSDENFIS